MSKRLAPEAPFPKEGWKKSKQKLHSGSEVGFSWIQFSQDGKPLHKFFLGVHREFEKKTKEERESIKRQYKEIFPRITNRSSGRGKPCH